MKKWTFNAGYVIIVTLIFFYYLFPTEAITSYINSKLSDSMPGVHATFSQIKPCFPPGLKLTSPVLYFQDKELINFDQLRIRPRYMTIFSQVKSFILSGSLGGGSVHGDGNLATSESIISVNLLLEKIEIGKMTALKHLIPHAISGAATGRVDYNNKPPYGNGKAEITLSGFQIGFKPAFFGMDLLKFDNINAGIEMTGNQLKVNKLNLNGPELNGKVSGLVTLRDPLAQSDINISGQIIPKPALLKNLGNILPTEFIDEKSIGNNGIPFKISGTFQNPSYSMK